MVIFQESYLGLPVLSIVTEIKNKRYLFYFSLEIKAEDISHLLVPYLNVHKSQGWPKNLGLFHG